jgi:hypothetical protein
VSEISRSGAFPPGEERASDSLAHADKASFTP